MTSRLNALESSVGDLPTTDNSDLLERITAVEINANNNTASVDELDADIEKIVEHIDNSFKKITDNMNSNPLSLGN